MRPVKPPAIRDPESRYEREAREAIKKLAACPLVSGALVAVRVDGPTECDHPLQRVPRGYLVVDADGPVFSAQVGGHTRTKLFLDSDSPTIATLWVF